ncbi:hypothetical protein [Nocardia sp. BMG51109]|uniref:hypothetical protein n=1 Tax=Nocardia sp. BMG51109 TaxID=1056816 RepID=UPI0004659B1B|nr:hypothetical protein [Nocardia sp. BMG51109]
MGAAVTAAVTVMTVPGCAFVFNRVEVVEDDSAVDAAFQRVLDSRAPARLGDVITQAGLPFGSWDRMYTFSSMVESDEINDKLGTDAYWTGLPGNSDGSVQVFVNGNEAVGAYYDTVPGHGVLGDDAYATPDSAATPTSEVEIDQVTQQPTTFWYIEIEEFS